MALCNLSLKKIAEFLAHATKSEKIATQHVPFLKSCYININNNLYKQQFRKQNLQITRGIIKNLQII